MSAKASRDIKRLLKEIDSAKQEVAESKGQLKVIKKDLKELTGADDLEEVKSIVKSWETEVSELEMDLEEILTELKKNYDW